MIAYEWGSSLSNLWIADVDGLIRD